MNEKLKTRLLDLAREFAIEDNAIQDHHMVLRIVDGSLDIRVRSENGFVAIWARFPINELPHRWAKWIVREIEKDSFKYITFEL